MTGHGSKFSRKREAAIAALMAQRNVEEAARVVGIGTQTLYRWIKEEEFDAACGRASRAAFGRSIAWRQQRLSVTATTMLRIIVDNGATASTRLRAAAYVFGHARHRVEIEDIDLRVLAQEQRR